MSVALVGVEGMGLSSADVAEAVPGRLNVASLYDPVRVRAERAAEVLDPQPTVLQSVTKSAEQPGVVAAVILDSGWLGYQAAETFCEREHPVLWLDDWPHPFEWLRSGLVNDLLIPGLRLRYEPSTIRLRERIATDLGAADAIEVRTDRPLWEAADWAAWIAASPVHDGEPDATGRRVYLRSGVEVKVMPADSTAATVHCDHGVAEWTPTDLTVNGIKDERSGGRPATTALLDLFLRRIAGGLVPVPSVDDVRAAVAACSSDAPTGLSG